MFTSGDKGIENLPSDLYENSRLNKLVRTIDDVHDTYGPIHQPTRP